MTQLLRSVFSLERVEQGLIAFGAFRLASWFALGWLGVADGWSGVLTLGACVLLVAAAPFSVGSGYGDATLIGAAAGRHIGGGLGVLPGPTRAALAVFLGAMLLPVIVLALTLPGSAAVAEGAAWAPVWMAVIALQIGGAIFVARRMRRSVVRLRRKSRRRG